MDIPSFNELFRIARDEALTRNARLSKDAIEREGADANIILAGGVAAADEIGAQLAELAASIFLDSATGQLLDRLVFDRYGLARKPASPSVGSVEFRTTAANPADFTVPVDVIVQTADGIQFVTTQSALFAAGATGPVTVPVRSTLAGLGQRAKKDAINNIVTQITGSPTDLRVNNTLATAGDDDEETDSSLRDRARRFFTTARRGTLAALEAGALAVPGVRKAAAIEVIDALGRPARFVELIVSDAYTDLLVDTSPTPPAYQAQSQQLGVTIFNSLSDVRAAGIYVEVRVAQIVLLPVQLSLTFVAGVAVDAVAEAARAAIVRYINELSPGEGFSRTEAVRQLEMVGGLSITGNEIASPLGDVVAKPLQALRTNMNLVTAVSVQSDRPLLVTTNPDAFIVANFTGTIIGG